MSKIKNVLAIILSCVIIIATMSTVSFAAYISVTDQNLSNAFQKLAESEVNENNFSFSVANNSITITSNNENYILNYDLTNKPTFTLEVPIQKGMSYEEFQKQTDNLILPMYGYMSVANIQGVEFLDSQTYFLWTYMESISNDSFSSEDSYVIVDDLNLSDGITIEKTDDPKTIYTSEFGDKVMEYVNYLYGNTYTITDSSRTNSYVMTIERQDVTDTSCKLVSTIVVNTDVDFSSLKGFYNSIKNPSDTQTPSDNIEVEQTPTETPKDNASNANNTNNANTTNSNNNKPTSNEKIPYAGSSQVLIVLILVSAGIAILLGITNKKYENIK